MNGQRTSPPVTFMIITNVCEATPKSGFERFELLLGKKERKA
jgi:hypothetical protein